MKIKIKRVVEVDAKFLHVSASIRYWGDAFVNDVEDKDGDLIPCRFGDIWNPVINIDKGIITNWEEGLTADIHYKICDTGLYTVTDDLGNEIIKKDGYVPNILSPGGDGYGDYIIMTVREDGSIENWKIDLSEIFEEEDY